MNRSLPIASSKAFTSRMGSKRRRIVAAAAFGTTTTTAPATLGGNDRCMRRRIFRGVCDGCRALSTGSAAMSNSYIDHWYDG